MLHVCSSIQWRCVRSSLHDRLRCALLRALIALLLAAGIGLPVLVGIGQGFLLLRFLLIITVIILVCAVLSLRRRLFGITLVIAVLVSGTLYALQRTGPVADAILLFQDIILPVPQVLSPGCLPLPKMVCCRHS